MVYTPPDENVAPAALAVCTHGRPQTSTCRECSNTEQLDPELAERVKRNRFQDWLRSHRERSRNGDGQSEPTRAAEKPSPAPAPAVEPAEPTVETSAPPKPAESRTEADATMPVVNLTELLKQVQEREQRRVLARAAERRAENERRGVDVADEIARRSPESAGSAA